MKMDDGVGLKSGLSVNTGLVAVPVARKKAADVQNGKREKAENSTICIPTRDCQGPLDQHVSHMRSIFTIYGQPATSSSGSVLH